MDAIREWLRQIFVELDSKVEEINRERRNDELLSIPKAKVQLLGQMSLLAHKRVPLILSLAQTGDMDAFLKMDQVVKDELKEILKKEGLIYDEDNYLIWIPPKAKFEFVFDFEHVLVESLDPESALVSKAVKDPRKNRQLIREAIASDEFPGLIDRILENNGKLEEFA